MEKINDYLNSKEEVETTEGTKIVALKNGLLVNVPVDKLVIAINEYDQEGVLLPTKSSLGVTIYENGTESATIVTSTGTRIPLT